jgi:hypothetical protein
MATAAVLGQGTTYNLPNYVGELFALTPQDTPFTSAIGGLTGGRRTKSTKFGWQSYDERDGSTSRQRTEGADAPTAENRKRTFGENVVEIHQESVEVSYTKQAASNLIDSAAAGVEGTNPVTDEFEWQVDKQLKAIKRDIELTFISGTYQDGADGNADGIEDTPRKTRGLISAIATNVLAVSDNTGTTGVDESVLTIDMLNDISQAAWDNGGLSEGDTATIMLGSTQKRNLTAAAKAAGMVMPASRDVAGVHVGTIETDFGTLNVMLNRYMPDSDLVVVSLEECAPVFLEIPGKGFLFVEPLSKTGSAEKSQIYGEVGLWYGNEKKHGKITGLDTTVQSLA